MNRGSFLMVFHEQLGKQLVSLYRVGSMNMKKKKNAFLSIHSLFFNLNDDTLNYL